MTLQALLEDLVYFDDDMLYEHCKQEIKFSCRNMTHVIHDGFFFVKKAQKWSLKRSTIQNELRNKCKTSNWRHIICTKVSILEWTIFRMRTVQHSQGEVNIIRICVMTEYRGGSDERRTLYYIFLLEVGRM